MLISILEWNSDLNILIEIAVAGGDCNLPLGISKLEIKVKGCSDEDQEYLIKQEYEQSSYEKVYNNVPAQFLEVKIKEIGKIEDGEYKDKALLTNFFNGADPIVRTINLLTTEEEDKIESEVVEEEDNGDKGTNNSEVKDKEDYKSTEEEKETVRFQYDGMLEMIVDVNNDDLDCNPTSENFMSGENESFHVVEYMTIIDISIKLRFDLSDGKYCNIVDPGKHKISIVSNLGMDRIGGFEKFYSGLPSDKERELISVCSTIAPPSGAASGPCLLDIESGESGSGKELKLAVGRPNSDKPYTKNINIRVVGAANNVQHRADFFVSGQFSLGAGDSFALPTHQPVMVLRDPPVSSFLYKYLILKCCQLTIFPSGWRLFCFL